MARSRTPVNLPDTLAQRVQTLREMLGLSTYALSRKTLIDEEAIQDIEQGLTLFLSAHTRNQLAKGLRVRPDVLEAAEKPYMSQVAGTGMSGLTAEEQVRFIEKLVNEPELTPNCPRCDERLMVQRFLRQDLQGHDIHAVKVRCAKCWFKLDHG